MPIHNWGRREQYQWPSARPVWLIGAFVVALCALVVIQCYRYSRIWTPLERFYLGSLVRSRILANLQIQAGDYRLLKVVDRKGRRLAIDLDVTPVEAAPAGYVPLALSRLSLESGAVKLVYEAPASYDNSRIYDYLSHWIYRDQTLFDLAYPALLEGLAVLVLGLVLALPKERERIRLRRYGRRLKGPELVRAAEFNERNQSTGVGFATDQPPSWTDRVLRRESHRVHIPRELESHHFLLMGDTGMGKSTLIRQILLQVAERAETAIVYDPALEYTPEFYNPERGDRILNPLDERTPYWSPGQEVTHEAEALTLAASLYPDRPHKDPFFTRAPRELFAHLLTLNPTPEELAWWMCHDQEIDRRVAGTEVASMIAPSAPAQREGVLSELKAVGKLFRLLPRAKEGRKPWSTREWANERNGWLFLTSTPQTREWLLPLTSLWLDILVLRLMNQGRAALRPAWFVLDELATLQKLPQLHTAITENRKSNNPVVLGFQGRSQLEERYGKEAETMFSQPGTKIFLRTSEPHAANWVSETIGEIEIERLRETRTSSFSWRGRQSESYQLDRQVERLVMASEIMGLRPRQGFLKSGNLVLQLSFPYIKLPRRQPAFLERALRQPLRDSLLPGAPEPANGDHTPGLKRDEPTEQPSRGSQAAMTHGTKPFFD